MRKALEILLNRVFKNDLEILYGDGAYVIINNVRYSDYQKLYLVDCVLVLNDNCIMEELNDTYPDGLNYLLTESWKFIVVPEKTQLLSTIKYV